MEVSVADLRTHFKDIVSRIKLDKEPATVTKNGHPEAVLLDVDDYNSMMETLYLLSNSANNKRIDNALQQLKKKKMQSRKLIDA